MNAVKLSFCAAIALCLSARSEARADASPREVLLEGVERIAAPGTPGTVAVWGSRAWPVLAGRGGGSGGPLVPVVAAAEMGRGRVVLFGHTGYLDSAAAAEGETGRLIVNSVRWAAGGAGLGEPGHTDGPGAPIRVGVTGCGIGEFLGRSGCTVIELGGGWDGALADIDVLAIVRGIDDRNVDALSAFVKRGGGVLVAQTGWGWRQNSGDRELPDAAFNKFLAPAGVGFSGETAGRTGPVGFNADTPFGEFLHGGRALGAIIEAGEATDAEGIGAQDRAQVFTSAMAAARLLPADDREYRARLDALLAARGTELVPAEKKPLGDKHPLERFLLGWQIEQARFLPASKVTAHPAASEFPGSLPSDAVSVATTVEVNTGVPGWASTGLYAAAGERVIIEAPEWAVELGLAVRIGCHTDGLWHLREWKRAPEVSMSRRLNSPMVEVASAFGGLVYIDVPRLRGREGREPRVVPVRFAGAYEAPLFVLGETTPEQWRQSIRGRPAPWAELATRSVVVCVPSERIRELDDPEPVLRMWDAVLDSAADLATIPRRRERPERYVADVQISAGYMHSGYPIMTHLDAAADMVSADALKRGCWGLFHELGHNHQEGEWTFDGTVEVTCNLFALYALDTVCGVEWTAGHGGMKDRDRKIGVHLGKGARFEDWKADPFLALQMYAQLVEGFGWETYRRVFAEYRALPRDERPRTEEQKRDQWMVRFSRAAERNLGPFFQAWGVPTSAAARASIADLPEWMPPGFPPGP